MSAKASALRTAGGDRLVLGGALALSLLVVWFASHQAAVVLAFAAGLAGLGGIAWLIARQPGPAKAAEFAIPDWSVTVAAIDRNDSAVAITDRAGRLVCANLRFEGWFGAEHAPPRLPVDNMSLERLAKAAREPGATARAQPTCSRMSAVAGLPRCCAPGAAMTIWSGPSPR